MNLDENLHKIGKEELQIYLEHEKEENRLEQEANLKELEVKHPFALKMALLITSAIVCSIIILAVSFTELTIKTGAIVGVISLIFGIISFKVTQSSCL